MGKPKIRFKGYTEDWEQRKLGDLCQITMGQSPDGSTYSDEPSDYILVQGNADLKDGWVVPRIWTTQKTKSAQAGDLIMSVRAPAGAMGKTAYDAVIGRGVAAIKGNEFIYQSLVKYDSDGYWKKLAAGSTFESVNSNVVKGALISVPQDIEEQVKIGEYFHNLDNLITFHQRKCNETTTLKKYMLQKMIPINGEIYPEIRFSGFTDAWEQRKLEELDFIISDGNYGELYPKANELLSEGVPFIRVNNLVDGYLVHKDLVYISEKQHSVLTSGHLKANDILITTRGEIGKIALVDSSFENANINAQICLIRTQENMASKYLHQYLQTNLSQMEITSFQTGSALKQLPKKRLGDITINYPSLMEEQIQIGNFFTNLDNLITLHQRECDELQNIKKYMLQNMFV